MDKSALQAEIAALNPKKIARRYPPKLREKIRAYKTQNPQLPMEKISKELDVSVITLKRILLETQTFVPIKIRNPPSTLCIRTEALVVEGLSRDDVVYVLKALSC